MRSILAAVTVSVVGLTACTTSGPSPSVASSSSPLTSSPTPAGSPSAAEAAAAEFVIHVEKPKNIGEADWGDSILQTAWETACAEDMGKRGFSWGGRIYNVSDDGVGVTIHCDDGSRHSIQVIFESQQ